MSTSDLVAISGFIALFAMMAVRVPIGIAMGVVGVSGFAAIAGWGPALNLLAQSPIRTVTDFNLTLIPFFILMGVLAYALLLPLALTSNNAAIRRMRGANWQALHRLVYLVAGFAIVHFLWMRGTKNDVLEVWIYALILTALMAWRLWHWNRGSSGGSCSH